MEIVIQLILLWMGVWLIFRQLTLATRLRHRRRYADAATVVVFEVADLPGGRAGRLITAEEQLNVGMIRSRVNGRQHRGQLRQTRRRHRSFLKGNIFRDSRPIQVVLIRLIDSPR